MKDQQNELAPIGERLRQYMHLKKIGVNKMGSISGTSGAQIHNILKGKKYGIDKMINIFKQFPDLNVLWVLFGHGEMIQDQYEISYGEQEMKSVLQKLAQLEKKNEMLKLKNITMEKTFVFQDETIQAQKETIALLQLTNENKINKLPFKKMTSQA